MSKQSKIHHLQPPPTVEFTDPIIPYSRVLAAAIGENESLIFLQLIWLLPRRGRPYQREQWLRMSVRDWSAEIGKGTSTAHRAVKKLLALGLVRERTDRGETWYTVNWDMAVDLPGITIANLPTSECTTAEQAVPERNSERADMEQRRSRTEQERTNMGRHGVPERNTSIYSDQESREIPENTPPNPPTSSEGEEKTTRDLFHPANGFPTLQEVTDFCLANGIPKSAIEPIYDYHMANGWKRPKTDICYNHWGYAMKDRYNLLKQYNNIPGAAHDNNTNDTGTDEEWARNFLARINSEQPATYPSQIRRAANDG